MTNVKENLKNINESIREVKELFQDSTSKNILEESSITVSEDKKEDESLVISSNAKPGDYLYSNLSWSTKLIEEKKVIGICVKAKGEIDDKARFISIVNMSLKTPEVGTTKKGNDIKKNPGAGIKWGKWEELFGVIKTNGFENTKKVIDKLFDLNKILPNRSIPNKPEYYPAVQVCYHFNAGEKDLSGKWYLPAIDELIEIDIDLINKKLKPLVEKNLAVYIGSYILPVNDFGYGLWSSTECNDGRFWYLYISDNNNLNNNDNNEKEDYNNFRVRAMIAV